MLVRDTTLCAARLRNVAAEYPALYLIHGIGDDQTSWVQFGEVQHITDKSIADGMASPMVIVMPDANTRRRGDIDSTVITLPEQMADEFPGLAADRPVVWAGGTRRHSSCKPN